MTKKQKKKKKKHLSAECKTIDLLPIVLVSHSGFIIRTYFSIRLNYLYTYTYIVVSKNLNTRINRHIYGLHLPLKRGYKEQSRTVNLSNM